MIMTRKGMHQFSFEHFLILVYIFNPAGKMQESLEERMQSANKAWWRDAKIYQSKDVPWGITEKEQWNKSTACFVLSAKVGHGAELLWAERSWETKLRDADSDSKEEITHRGLERTRRRKSESGSGDWNRLYRL